MAPSPAARTRRTASRYTSVLPLPVTPKQQRAFARAERRDGRACVFLRGAQRSGHRHGREGREGIAKALGQRDPHDLPLLQRANAPRH